MQITEEDKPDEINKLWHEYYTANKTIYVTPRESDYVYARDINGYIQPMKVTDLMGQGLTGPTF